MSFRPFRVLPVLVFPVVVAAALAAACSSNADGGPSTAPVTGPTFSFAFPTAGSPPSSPGTSNQRDFTEVGSWNYHCIPHASVMQGTVIVTPGTTDPESATVSLVGTTLGSLAYSPASVTIRQGGHVRWVNFSSFTNHTVTRP